MKQIIYLVCIPVCVALLMSSVGCITVGFDSDPQGAKTYLNGTLVGETPFVRTFGLFDGVDAVAAMVLPGYDISECPMLTPGGGGGGLLVLTSAPPGGIAYKDGQKIGVTPMYDTSKIPSSYRVVFPPEVLAKSKYRLKKTIPQVKKSEATLPLGKISQRWAVVIGIADYKNKGEQLSSLKYAANDARAFSDFLKSPAGGSFPKKNVLLLTNKQATTRNIRKSVFSFLKRAIREDLVVIYFSGHGAADPERPKNLYLLSYDTDPADIAGTAFPMDDIRKSLVNTVEAQRVVVLADACHSGGVSSSGGDKGVRVGQQNEALNRYWAELSKTSPGRVIFTSSDRSEISQESAKWGGGHGVFTWTLLEGLKGAADSDANGIVTLGEAIRYTDQRVRRETRSAQHPTVAGEKYDRNLPMGVVK